MRPVGGFFELEVGAGGESWHPKASALTSGRACLGRILGHLRPRVALVPFYTCEAVLEPLLANGIAIRYYALSESLEPELDAGPAGGECLIYINYFGLKGEAARRLSATFGERAIIDDTHGYFATGYPGAWSFNSARKFFGVPDGGYLYSPDGSVEELPPNLDVRYDHLVNRLQGHHHLAFAQYQESERHVCGEPRGMSPLAARLLRQVDHPHVRTVRRRNFHALHERLGSVNQLSWAGRPIGEAVPFCYPLLPDGTVPHERLWASSLFVPRLWPDVPDRKPDGFPRERALSDRLLPLPVDHRYGEPEMSRLADVVMEVLA